MAGAGHKDRSSSGPVETTPPFWLCAEDHGVRIIDARVVAIAEENWQWAFCLVKNILNEGANTPEVVEHVAIEVTNRLRVDPDVGRNLGGYFRTAIVRRVRALANRDSRIAYQGGTQDLETNHCPPAPDWTKICEDRMTIEWLLPYVPHSIRRILHLRLLDYSWKNIAHKLTITEQTARKRFSRAVRQAYDELLSEQAKRWQEEGHK
jgi:hypothetical protein